MECFAVPTTSGTGSEVTDYAVITDSAKGIKYPLDSQALRPPVAILDPDPGLRHKTVRNNKTPPVFYPAQPLQGALPKKYPGTETEFLHDNLHSAA